MMLNDKLGLIAAAVIFGAAVIYILFFRKDQFTEYQEKERQQRRDNDALTHGVCPACRHAGTLIEPKDPSREWADKIACSNCLQEYAVVRTMGEGVCASARMGPLGYRRAGAYGIPANQVAESLDDPQP